MKKYRFLSFFLALALTAGLLLPVTALADEAKELTVAEMKVNAGAAILVDADNDEVLYEQNAHEKMFPASITKVMTALLVFEAIDQGKLSMNQSITASDTHTGDLSSDGSTQNIKPGEIMTVEQLLNCLLVASANEAGNILAEAVAGDVASFVELMNQKAQELGCENTQFVNSHGLHNAEHYTTAYDISLFVRAALKYDGFRKIVSQIDHTVPATNLHETRHFYNTNALITSWTYMGYTYKYAIGVKTGTTPEAGHCLASAAVKDGRTLVVVVLNTENTLGADGKTVQDRPVFSESKRLLEWGYDHFSRKSVMDSTSLYQEMPVTLSKEANYVGVQPQGSIEATLPDEMDPTQFEHKVTLTAESVEAPVAKGQVMGSVTVSYDGKDYGTLPLVAVADVERSELLYRLDQIKQFLSQLWVRVALIALGLLILFLVLRWLIFGKKTKYGRSAYGGGRQSKYGGRRRRK